MTPFTYYRDTWRILGLRDMIEIMVSQRHRGIGIAIRQDSGWRTRYIFYHPALQFSRRLNFVGW